MEADDDKLVDLLEAAKHYEMDSLVCKVEKRVMLGIRADNVFQMYEQVRKLENPAINRFIVLTLQSSHKFGEEKLAESLSRSSVELILSQPKLKLSETELFAFLLEWTQNQARRQRIESPTAEQKRKIMGDLLYLIRFPSIEPMQCLKMMTKSQAFSPQEMFDFVNYLTMDSKPVAGIVSRLNLKQRFSASLMFEGPFSSTWTGNRIVKQIKQIRLPFTTTVNVGLQEVVIFSAETSQFSLSILNEQGHEIASTTSVPSLEENIFSAIFRHPIDMRANVKCTLVLTFDEIKTELYEIEDVSSNYERKHRLGRMIFELERFIPRNTQIYGLGMLGTGEDGWTDEDSIL